MRGSEVRSWIQRRWNRTGSVDSRSPAASAPTMTGPGSAKTSRSRAAAGWCRHRRSGSATATGHSRAAPRSVSPAARTSTQPGRRAVASPRTPRRPSARSDRPHEHRRPPPSCPRGARSSPGRADAPARRHASAARTAVSQSPPRSDRSPSASAGPASAATRSRRAAQYQPGKRRSPRDQRNVRTGSTSSNRLVTQSRSGPAVEKTTRLSETGHQGVQRALPCEHFRYIVEASRQINDGME